MEFFLALVLVFVFIIIARLFGAWMLRINEIIKALDTQRKSDQAANRTLSDILEELKK